MLTQVTRPVQSVAVVGAGLMGRRIAGVMARAGLTVVITDTQAQILEQAVVDAQAMCPGQESNVTSHADLAEAVAGVDLVIEAIVENLEARPPRTPSSQPTRRSSRSP